MFDGAAFGEQTVNVVRGYVERATAPLLNRIAVLEQRELRQGEPGRDADMAAVAELIDRAVEKALAALPAPKDGEPGRSVDPVEVRRMVDEAVAALPAPADGKDVDPATVRALVAEAVAALPAPRDGEPGADADPETIAALVRLAVAALPPAKDGVGVAGAVIDRQGHLLLTLSDGGLCELGLVVGTDGEPGEDAEPALPGRDGTDGVGFDDLAFEHDGERGFVLRFVKGERAKEFRFAVPTVLDRGVFKEGGDYQQGDAVTFGGSLWIAQRATNSKPDGADTGWRLAVKKGRDGRDARP